MRRFPTCIHGNAIWYMTLHLNSENVPPETLALGAKRLIAGQGLLLDTLQRFKGSSTKEDTPLGHVQVRRAQHEPVL